MTSHRSASRRFGVFARWTSQSACRALLLATCFCLLDILAIADAGPPSSLDSPKYKAMKAEFLDIVSRPFLVMTIIDGRKGTAMQAWRDHDELPVGLPEAFDMADYLLSLRPDQEPGSFRGRDAVNDRVSVLEPMEGDEGNE